MKPVLYMFGVAAAVAVGVLVAEAIVDRGQRLTHQRAQPKRGR